MARMRWLAVLVTALALIAAACSSSSSDTTAASSDTTAASSESDTGSGTIIISGSSTVEPISAINAEAFRAVQPEVGISVEGPGTGDGFKKFCAGETDISDASRAIKDSEKEACAAAGIEFVELQVAIDGLSVLTSHANDQVACLSFNDLYALLGPESTGFGKWSDANDLAAELEATSPPYPDADLTVTAPGPESGTYDTFVEFTIEDVAEERGQEAAPRLDYTASANDNVIIEGIAGSDTSLGWVGYAFYLAAQDEVKALEVDGGDGTCVGPTPETIADGTYPLSRPLFIYVDPAKAQPGTALADYVDFYLSEDGLAAVDQSGYVRLADYEPVRSRWENRETGSVASP
ncbi:MAG: phosphate ABC transporter substrate-binding protein PstS family protein [Actinomycetota bacterium]|nr:phosphate ABC transporter substrate-binding protein PstS family protein [Actinomycetota bacterium]